MCNLRLCLAKKKTEICFQKALIQNVMPRLSLRDRDRALGQLEVGRHADGFAADFGCHVSTIYRLMERHRVTEDVSDRRRNGRPRVTSVRQDRLIRLTHLRNSFKSAAATSRQTRGLNNRRISVDTVRRRLRNAGLRARRPYWGPRLTGWHRAERLRWCRNNVNRRLRDWHDMLFSDESRFCVDHADGRWPFPCV